jgi:hypothetical protein
MEIGMEVPQKLKIELPYDSGIPLLGIDLKELKVASNRDTCPFMFIVVLFTIAKSCLGIVKYNSASAKALMLSGRRTCISRTAYYNPVSMRRN